MKYSLRSLMIVVTLICVALSSLSVLRFRIARRHRAVEAIKALGGAVEYDFEWEGATTPTGVAVDVGRVLGDEYAFSDVSMVAFGGRDASDVNDRNLALLRQFPRLRCLHLVNTNVSDADLGMLSKFQELEFLGLRGRPLTMNDVEQLRPLLKRLDTFRMDALPDGDVRNKVIELLPPGSELEEINRNHEPHWRRTRKS